MKNLKASIFCRGLLVGFLFLGLVGSASAMDQASAEDQILDMDHVIQEDAGDLGERVDFDIVITVPYGRSHNAIIGLVNREINHLLAYGLLLGEVFVRVMERRGSELSLLASVYFEGTDSRFDFERVA